MEWKGDGDTGDIILVEGSHRQIYPAALPCDTAHRAMLDFVVYLLYRAGLAIASRLPLPVLFALGEFLGFCAWLFSGKYRRLAERNVAVAFANEKTPREMRRLVRRHFQRLGANLLCSVKLTAMAPEKILQRVNVDNIEAMDREFRAGVPVVLVLSHLGTWELFAQLMPKFVGYVRNASVYQKLGNRFIDAHVRRTRGQTGLELFDRQDGFQPVIDLLRSGGGVGVLSDQHAGDHGLWTPFFGKLASTSPLPALLAKRTRAALIAACVYTTGPARWRMVFTERFDPPKADASIAALTSEINQIIEQQIRVAPEDWFWVHNRWKTPQPNFLLAQYKRGVHLPPGVSPQDLKPFRILIRSSNWLGDAAMSVPAVRAIKAGRPDARITIAAPEKIAPVWKLIPEVDVIIALPGSELLSSVRLLRREPSFDVAILFPNSVRAALESWLTRIPRRVGYCGHSRRWLLNQIVPVPRKPGPPEHHSLRFLRIARECGADTLESYRSQAGVQYPTRNVQTAINRQPIKIGLCPGAEYGPAKRWLPKRFAEAAEKISSQSSVQWILFGTPRDATVAAEIAAALGDHCVNRVGQTTLEQLIDELRECCLLLTNDTGAMHLAALLGVPVVAIFGSTEPRFTGPLGDGHIVLRHHVECSPCFLRECPIDFRCMKAVSVQEVANAVLSILRAQSDEFQI
ncbi:MAG TPA: lipopolysaccharide heptosyltransferase II [Candidatus Udaeobacter sp.]|jgi:lipopolysaccharide heptosyltransferase II|nr:lipopolysaccharide heptosyltransferase II [Candidatus Udaeobacter sp.]